MPKRSLIFSLVVVLILGFAILAFAQRAAHSQPEFGYYDRSTGTFTPVQQAAAASDAEPRAVTDVTGELILKYNITVKSTIPKNGVISCTGSAGVSDSTGSTTERATGIATLVSGTTYTCSAIIHYSWALSTPTTDKIGFVGAATIDYGYQYTATNGADTAIEPVEARSSAPTIAPISVPANGVTTTIDINVTL
jgi:hypothetical protein